MEINGLTNSKVALVMAMGQARIESAMSVSSVKDELQAHAEMALSLIATVEQVQPTAAGGSGGSQVDMTA